jgi:hypothetical protein
MAKVFSRQERFYLQDESAFGTIPNSGGTATVAAADACAMIQFKMNRTTDSIFRKDKTGSRTATAGIAGRKIANWSSNMSLVTSGVAGTIPDCDPILKSLFGAAAASKTGTLTVSAATNASPIQLTTGTHGLSEYDAVTVTGVTGNTAANGIWLVHVVDTTNFTLLGSAGNAAWISGGSVSKVALCYTPTDTELSFTGWSFRTPAGAQQRAIMGAVAQQGTFNLGEDIATWQATGLGKWVLDSNGFSTATLTEKAGLSAFPTEPSTPVTAGAGIAGFKGMAFLNGGLITRIRTAQIKYGSGLELPRDLFGSEYVDSPEADERQVFLNFNMYEDDSAAQLALENAAISKTGLDMLFQVGLTAGSIYFLVLRGVQLVSPDRDDGQRAFTMAYGDSRAYGSGITSFNELKLWAI